jgi:glycosyltransferase involved in cell wall biosynthesis
MKVLQINVTYGFGSTGKLVQSIHEVLLANGHDSYVAFGRNYKSMDQRLIQIGSSFDVQLHGIKSRLFDRHGYGSKHATQNFLNHVDLSSFDVIHIHNIHGYYVHIDLLMNALKSVDKPIVWTLHDAWSYTGHCAYYDQVGCTKWQTGCFACPQKRSYPSSILMDQSKRNYNDKKFLFQGFNHMTLVTPSQWLKDELSLSYLKEYLAVRIVNGIDLKRFPKPTVEMNQQFTILGVASYWEKRKGLIAFKKLAELLPQDIKMIIVGQLEKGDTLPSRITWIPRTDNFDQLIHIYQRSDCFINPTVDDNLPTTSIESLAAGTPVITYDTGGSSEIIDKNTGILVDKNDIMGLYNAIMQIKDKTKLHYQPHCLERSKLFDHHKMVSSYLDLYKEVTS